MKSVCISVRSYQRYVYTSSLIAIIVPFTFVVLWHYPSSSCTNGTVDKYTLCLRYKTFLRQHQHLLPPDQCIDARTFAVSGKKYIVLLLQCSIHDCKHRGDNLQSVFSLSWSWYDTIGEFNVDSKVGKAEYLAYRSLISAIACICTLC